MLESVFASVLNRVLSAYVDNLNYSQLNVGIWSGDIKLKNLRLKQSALDKFDLPVLVTEGYLGDLTVTVPWSNLKNAPIKIKIHNLYLLAVPEEEVKYDKDVEEERQYQSKLARLDAAEAALSSTPKGDGDDDGEVAESFTTSLVNKMVQNLQFEISNVHIRYEDHISCPSHPFSIGLTLAHFSTVSTDEQWQPAYISNPSAGVHKLTTLESLAIYWDTDSSSLAGKPVDVAMVEFTSLIAQKDQYPPNLSYILKPVSGRGKLTMHRSSTKERAKTNVEIDFENIAFALKQSQYRDALVMLDSYHLYSRKAHYRHLRPNQLDLAKNRPRAMLRYALKAVLEEIHNRNYQWTDEYVQRRFQERKRYIKAFKSLKSSQKTATSISSEEIEILERSERKFSYQDIWFFRSIARSELRKERIEFEKDHPIAAATSKPSQQSWVGWVWSGVSSAAVGGTHSSEANTSDVELNDEQRKELYEAIGWDETLSHKSEHEDKNLVRLNLQANIQKGSLVLCREPRELISISFQNMCGTAQSRADSLAGDFSLGDFEIIDSTSKNQQYRHIVRVQDKIKEQIDRRQSLVEDLDGLQESTISLAEPFFSMSFKGNPPDASVDNELTLRMRHLQIIYHRGYVEEVMAFFKPPDSHMESMHALLDVAAQSLASIRKSTRAGLEFALAQHKTIDLTVDMNAPIIILPENTHDANSKHLVLDAGHISVRSDLADKTVLKEIEAKSKSQYSDSDYTKLESLMYDRFTLNLEDAQVLLGGDIASCLESLGEDSCHNSHFLEKTSLNFAVHTSIVPQAVQLARFKVEGKLAFLQLNFSDRKYKSFMKIIEANIPLSQDEIGPKRENIQMGLQRNALKAVQQDIAYPNFDQITAAPVSNSEDVVNDKDDTFYDTSPPPEDQDPAYRQHQYEFNFKVDSVHLDISREDHHQTRLLFAKAKLSALNFNAVGRQMDMQATVELGALMLDTMNSDYKAMPMVVSKQSQVGGLEKPLIHVKYHRVQAQSPEYSTIYDSMDQSVDAALSTIFVNMEPEPILNLYDFVMTTFTSNDEAIEPMTSISAMRPANVSGVSAKIKVKLNLETLKFFLMDCGETIGILSLDAAEITVFTGLRSLRVSAQIGNLKLMSGCVAEQKGDAVEILAVHDDHFAVLSYEVFDPDMSYSNRGHGAELNLKVSPVRFVFLESATRKLLVFLTKISKLKLLYDSARDAAANRVVLAVQINETIKILAGLRGINLYTMDTDDRKVTVLSNLDFEVTIDQLHQDQMLDSTNIEASLGDITIRMSQRQYNSLYALLNSIFRVLDQDLGQTDLPDTPIHNQTSSQLSPIDFPVDKGNKLQISFKILQISLELLVENQENLPESATSLTKMTLRSITVSHLQSQKDGIKLNLALQSIAIDDTGDSRRTKYPHILSGHLLSGAPQVAVAFSQDPHSRHNHLQVEIASAVMILAIDPLSGLLAYIMSISQADEWLNGQEHETSASVDTTTQIETSNSARAQTQLEVVIKLRKFSVDVLHDEKQVDTEAIRLCFLEAQMQMSSCLEIKISKLEMFLGRMDRNDSRLRFLDSMDLRAVLPLDGSTVREYEINLDQIVMRSTSRDILLIASICNKAYELYDNSRRPSASIVTKATSNGSSKFERLSLISSGFQWIMIGDAHELAMLHWVTQPFVIDIRDWSIAVDFHSIFNTSLYYFNLTNSHWEPLLDPWQLSLQGKRLSGLQLSVVAEERMELNITPPLLEFVILTYAQLSQSGYRLLDQPRKSDAPFKILNQTGYNLSVWTHQDNQSRRKSQSNMISIADGASVDWAFDDSKTLREDVNATVNNQLGIRLESTAWESIRGILVDREGQFDYPLRPKVEEISHHILADVSIEENVKTITFRSHFDFRNQTLQNIEFQLFDVSEKEVGSIHTCRPGEMFALPIVPAFDCWIRLRPVGPDYDWSSEKYSWRSFMRTPGFTISCKPRLKGQHSFLLRAATIYDIKNFRATSYPMLSVRLWSPIDVENLLPYDITYRIYDRVTRMYTTMYLRAGGSGPVHTAELTHFLIMDLKIHDSCFKQSDFAIINTDNTEDFPIESKISLKDETGSKLELRLAYIKHNQSAGAFKIQIFSSYVLYNKTGFDLSIRNKSFFTSGTEIAGLQKHSTKSKNLLPILIGENKEDGKNRFLFRIGNSEWSQAINFEPSTTERELSLSLSNQQALSLSITSSEGIGKYKLSKVITVAPRFIVVNCLDSAITLRQFGSQDSNAVSVPAGHRKSIVLLEISLPRLLVLNHIGGTKSAPFSMTDLGKIYLRSYRNNDENSIVVIEVASDGSSIFIYVRPTDNRDPIRIENSSPHPVRCCQIDTDDNPELNVDSDFVERKYRNIPEGTAIGYVWDQPAASNRHLKLKIEGKSRVVDIAQIGDLFPLKIKAEDGSLSVVALSVIADGSSQVLKIQPYIEQKSAYKMKQKRVDLASDTSSNRDLAESYMGFEEESADTSLALSISFKFEGIGISCLNKSLTEILYVTLRGLVISYSEALSQRSVGFACQWAQVDNQLFGAMYPILLYPAELRKEESELEVHPCIQFSIIIAKEEISRSHGVICVRYMSILLQAIAIEFDEDLLSELIDMISMLKSGEPQENDNYLIKDSSANISEPQILTSGDEIYFEVFHIQPIKLDISFMRTESANIERRAQAGNSPLSFATNALTMTLGAVNSAPIKLGALLIENMRITLPVLSQRVQRHYTNGFISQLYRVLGSADFLGNPVGLFTNVGSGVYDIFYEPYSGMVLHGKGNLGSGISRGATSFVKKTVFGVSDSVTKVTNSISQGLSAATMDSDFQSKRRIQKFRNKPRHALYGVTEGANAFATSVASGFQGLALKPWQGAERDGAMGFFKGVGKGLVGAVTKPVVGVFDLASNITEGIRNTTTVFDQAPLDRVRLPRYVSPDAVLHTYDASKALGQLWLQNIAQGKFVRESYVAHLILAEDSSVFLLSTNGVFVFQQPTLSIVWHSKFGDFKTIQKESGGISFMLREMGDKGSVQRIVTVRTQSELDWLYGELKRVVVAYNQASQLGARRRSK